jgi:cytochrome P450
MTTTIGLPSTMPREARCYDPTTPAHLDERGGLHLYSYADVRAGLLDDTTLTIDLAEIADPKKHSVTCGFVWGADNLTVSGAPGRHATLRRLAEPMFSAAAVADLRPTLEAAADTAIVTALARARAGDPVELDLYRDLAVPYALQVACRLVGIDPAEGDWLIDQQRKLLDLSTAWPPLAQPDTDAMLAEVLARPRVAGSVTDLAACARARGEITDWEAAAQVWGYLQASVLTTAAGATSMIGLLVEHGASTAQPSAPDPRDQQVATARIVDEALRFSGVFPQVVKVVRAPHRRAGFDLVPGQQVHLWLPAADRDDAVNGAAGAAGPDPHAFVPRSPNRTLALSVGRHFCTGARLARAELAVLLDRLAAHRVEVELRLGWERYTGIEDGFTAAPGTLRVLR